MAPDQGLFNKAPPHRYDSWWWYRCAGAGALPLSCLKDVHVGHVLEPVEELGLAGANVALHQHSEGAHHPPHHTSHCSTQKAAENYLRSI